MNTRDSSAEAYGALKGVWHLDRIAELRAGRQIVPRQVQLVISDLCNHDCHFCAYRMSGGFSSKQFGEDTGNGFTMNPNRRIPTSKCLEIIDDLVDLGVPALQITGGGEPTVHPDHEAIIGYALDRGMQVGLVSNGYRVSEELLSLLPRMSWLRVSIDAANALQYSRIRSVGPRAWSRTMRNLGRIAEVVEGTDCLFGLSYVVTRENYDGLASAVAGFSELGASYVRLGGMFSEEGADYYGSLLPEIRAACASAQSHAHDGFRVINMFDQRIEDLTLRSPDYDRCTYQQFNMYIGGNQKVYRCCTTSYTPEGEIGDLSGQRFRDWFNSDEKRELIDGFSARGCAACSFNAKNRAVNYMLESDPTHVDFV